MQQGLAAVLARLCERTVDWPQEGVEYHVCQAGCCEAVSEPGSDVYVCGRTGRVHVCAPNHATCTDPTVRFDPVTKEGTATCRMSGATWEYYEDEAFTYLYDLGERGPQAPNSHLEGRTTTVSFEGFEADIKEVARVLDPERSTQENQPNAKGPDSTTQHMAREQTLRWHGTRNRATLEEICRQLLSRGKGPDHEAWYRTKARLDSKRVNRIVNKRMCDFVEVSRASGFSVRLIDLVAITVESAAALGRCDARRRGLTQRDLDIMGEVIKRRCQLLWPSFARRRLESLNRRRVEAGKPGVARDLHMSPETVNYAFHVLTVAYRSVKGEWELLPDGTRRCLMPAIPDLHMVIPPENHVHTIRLPGNQAIVSSTYTKVQATIKDWILSAIREGEVTSPLVCTAVASLEEYAPLLDADPYV